MLAVGPYGYLTDYFLLCFLYFSILVHAWFFFRHRLLQKHPRIRLILGNLLVFISLLSTVALAVESHLRFAAVYTDSFGLSLPARRWFAIYEDLNSAGCRDKEWTPDKPPGVRRIAFVGDSFCYGWGIKRVEDRYTDLIQARFNRPGPSEQSERVEVMNVAKPGWATADQITPIQDMIRRFHVDEIVLCYVFNDIEKDIPQSDDFTKPPEPKWFNPEFSCLMEYLFWNYTVPRLPTVHGYFDWIIEGYTDKPTFKRHQTRLGVIIGQCRAHQVKLRVVIQPFLQVQGTRFQQELLQAALREFFDIHEVEVLDLLPVVAKNERSELMTGSCDAHPNEKAHSLFADAIWQSFYDRPGRD